MTPPHLVLYSRQRRRELVVAFVGVCGHAPVEAICRWLTPALSRSVNSAAIHLQYEKNENFWLVTTVHAIKLKDLERIPLLWERK